MPLVSKIVFFLLFTIICLCAQGVPYNQEFKIQSKSEVQNFPNICTLKNGNYVITWETYLIGNFAQIYDNNFNVIGSEFKLVSKYGYDSEICSLSDGGFVFVWNSDSGIYFQIFEENGAKRGPEIFVDENPYHGYYRVRPKICDLAESKILISYHRINSDSSNSEIYSQLYDYNSNVITERIIVSALTGNEDINPDCVSLKNGNYVICWVAYYDQNKSSDGMYAQLFDSDGKKIDTIKTISKDLSDAQQFPALASLPDGGFVVCWDKLEEKVENYRDIHARIFNSDLTPRSQDFYVNTYKISLQHNPKTISLGDSLFGIFWTSYGQDGNQLGVFGQLFDNNGIKFADEFQINDVVTGNQSYFNISSIKKGGFTLVYHSPVLTGSGTEAYGKYYTLPIKHALNPYFPEYPKNDEIIKDTNPSLTWQKPSKIRINFPWELEYIIYLDEDEYFTSPWIIESIYDTTYTIQNLTPGTTYFWKVLAENIAGDSLWSSQTNAFFVDWDATTVVEEITDHKPQTFKLQQNYPNPFNPATTIAFELSSPSYVLLKIFDMQGREVAILKDEDIQAGLHQVSFNAENLASGVYYYMVQMGDYRKTKKMLLLK